MRFFHITNFESTPEKLVVKNNKAEMKIRRDRVSLISKEEELLPFDLNWILGAVLLTISIILAIYGAFIFVLTPWIFTGLDGSSLLFLALLVMEVFGDGLIGVYLLSKQGEISPSVPKLFALFTFLLIFMGVFVSIFALVPPYLPIILVIYVNILIFIVIRPKYRVFLIVDGQKLYFTGKKEVLERLYMDLAA